MNNKEAIEYGKKWDAAIESRGDTPFSEARQFLNLAIKAIRIVEVIEDGFRRDGNLMMDSDDWEDIKEFVEKGAEE